MSTVNVPCAWRGMEPPGLCGMVRRKSEKAESPAATQANFQPSTCATKKSLRREFVS